jgi:predicted transcriptional regulator
MRPEQCRAARQALGWSQERLGRAVGLPASHVSAYERTGVLPTPGEGFPVWHDELQAVLDEAGAFARAQAHTEQLAPIGSWAITREQCRGARRLLGWDQRRLAKEAKVNWAYIGGFERTGRMPEPRYGTVQRRLAAIRATLERAGVEFVDGTERPGVRLR